MTRDEYKQHLCEIICMVFRAEDATNKTDTDELADEIMRIDNELIPLWMKDFETRRT